MKKNSSTSSDINGKHSQAKQDLAKETRDPQQLFDEMASGFALHEIICDSHGKPVDYRFLKMNLAFERLTGLAAAEVIGKRALEVLPGLEPFWVETYGRVALTGQPERFENYSKDLDKYFSVVAYCPQQGMFAVLFEDITRRRQAEEALRLSEARYSTLVETAQDLIWQCDAEGRYIYLNLAWEEVFGYKLEEMLGKRFVDFQTPENAERDLREFNRLLKGDIVKGLETVHLGKDGRQIHLVFNAKQLQDADGQPAGTQGTAYDITARKMAQFELFRRNEDLALMNAINMAVINGDNLMDVINLISAKLKVLFNSFGATVNLVNQDRTRLVMQILTIPAWLKKSIEKLTGIIIPRIEHDLKTDHPYQQVFTTGQPQLINDMEGVQEFTKGFIRSVHVPEKIRNRLAGLVPAITKLINRHSIMVVPLVSNNVIIGTLDVGGQDPFNQADLLRLEAIAAGLTAVIQRKYADEEIFANEEKYRSLFNSMTEGVAINELVMDDKGNVVDYIILDVNPGFELNTAYKIEEALGKRATEIYQMSPEFITAWWQQHVAMGSTAYTELYHEPTQRWHAITTTRPVGQRFYTIFSDITARKLALQKIATSEAELRALFAAMTDVVIKYDAWGRYLEIAPTNPENLFHPLNDMLGRTVYDILPKAQADTIINKITECLQKSAVVSGEYSLPLEAGEVWFSANVTPLSENSVLWVAREITESKRITETLLESERRFRETLENVNLIAIEMGISGNINFCNDFFLQLTGWQRDEIIGKNWFKICLPVKIRDQVQQVFTSSLASGSVPVHYENEILTRQGAERLVSWNNTMLRDPAGNPIGVSCIGEDITEKRSAEELIMRSEAELKKAQVFAHVGSWVWNIKTGKLEWSDEMYKIFGIPKESFSGSLPEVVASAIHPDDRQKVEESNLSVATQGKPFPLEYRILHPDGSQRVVWAEAGELEKDAEGKPALLRGIVMDITERKRAEEELRKERQRMAGILQGTNAGTWEWNVQTGETIFNDRWAEIIGYTLVEISPMSIDTWMKYAHPDDLKVSDELIEKHFRGEIDYYEFESRMKHKDGNWIWVMDRGKVISWTEDGKPLVMMGTHQDITKSKQAEEALQKSELRYRERANELETIMDIVPVALWVAHDPACHVVTGNRTANELHRIQAGQNASMTQKTGQQFRPGLLKIFHEGVEIQPKELPLQVSASKGIEIRNYESQIVFEDGTVIHEIGNTRPLFDEFGQPRGAVGAFTDITGQKQVEKEIRRRAEELDGLQKTVLDITAAQSLPGLLESIVERACQLLGATGGGLYLNDTAKAEVRVVVSYNTSNDYVGIVLKHGEGVAGNVAQDGQPLNISDYPAWPGRSSTFEQEKPFSAVLGVPLLWAGQVRGVIDLFYYEPGQSFDSSALELATLFAGHAAIAIENSRLLEASQAGQTEVRTLSTRLAEAEENERRRIARELHDQVGQSLSALSINMNIMHSQIPEYLPGFKRRLDDSLMLIDQTTDHIRNLMSELRPAVLDDYGLKAALDWIAGSIANRTNLKLLVEGECNRFPPRVEIALFRIAQETLGNIARHAHASNVKILLTQNGPDMSLSITDNGVGFDPSAVAATEKSGWGLRLMAERAESIGASLQVESTPGQGTCITARYHDDNSTGR